jgi:hypothetical protein
MKDTDIYAELSSIRNLMERSTKFISLSGLSGILAGVYALIGAFIGYKILYTQNSGIRFNEVSGNDLTEWWPLFMVAFVVLFLSILTGILLTIKQARKTNESYWNPVSRRMVMNMSVPLVTGGLLILITAFKAQWDYGLISCFCLIFYGLALVAGSPYTFTDIKWLGLCEIVLGLLAALLPEYGFVFWVIGFGILHIVYGSVMHFKYKQ